MRLPPRMDQYPIAPILPLDTPDTLTFYCSKLLPEQKHELAKNFALTVNALFPVFQQESFPDQLMNGRMCNSLSSIIYAVSAKAKESYFWCETVDIDTSLACFAESTTIEAENVGDPLALNQWRTSCLLAWFCFHQSPSNAAAIRITVLTRKAYQCGLHQIDSVENRASFGWDLLDEETLEDWRHLWWCIYILDAHASYLRATPHQVELESLRTALPQSVRQPEPNRNASRKKLLLPVDRGNMWATVQDILNTEGDKAAGLHMAISTLLKEVVTLRRLYNQNAHSSSHYRMSALDDYLNAIQFTLPANFMRLTRDVLQGEPGGSYRCRLLTLLKIYCIRLLLRLPIQQVNESEWHIRWQECLEICYDMVAVIQHWDVGYCLAIDPAVCFITFALLVILHLQSLSSTISNPTTREQIGRRQIVTRLFLQTLSRQWALPRFLLDCYDKLVRKIYKRMDSQDIIEITGQFHGPLHQKWLNFLSLAPTVNCSTEYRTERYSTDSLVTAAPDVAQEIELGEGFGPWSDFDCIFL